MLEGLSGKRKVHDSANFIMPLKLADVKGACDELLPFMEDKQLNQLGALMAWEFWPNKKIMELHPTFSNGIRSSLRLIPNGHNLTVGRSPVG